MSDFYEAWKIRERDFPHDGSAEDKLAFCARYAILAPSTYNTQPWYFKIKDGAIGVYADRRYALPVIDPDDRELSMACAAALFNLRLAIRHFGYADLTELLPDPADQNCLARVKIGEKLPESGNVKDIFDVIPKRHTNRGPFSEKDVPEDVLRDLKAAAAEEGAWLHICSPAERGVIVSMIVEGDLIQNGKKNFRRELAAWLDPRREKSGDGLPNYAMDFKDMMSSLVPQIVRRFETGKNKPVNDDEIDEGSPVIAILGSRSGGLLETLYAGQGMQRMLLKAEALGLSVCPLNQPCEVPELRLRLHDEIDHHGRAQMVFRIGYGGKTVQTPRRPLESCLEYEGKSFFTGQKPANKNRKKGWLPNFLAKRA